MKILKIITVCFALFFMQGVRADVAVLVHGWATNADTWLQSGIHSVLLNNGWQDAGLVWTTPMGVSYQGNSAKKQENSIYRVSLPAQAPMLVQGQHLRSQLDFIAKRHAGEKLHIVGHSAGGIVARLVLIQPDAPAVNSLITIATPHLGSHRAIEGLDVAHAKPFFCPGPGIDVIKNIVAGDRYRYLRDSSPALVDLVPATNGSMLGWLNRQPHPAIIYHSIVKHIPGKSDDGIVPVFSQDMNQVAAIRGRATTHMSVSDHGLNPADGALLVSILGSH